MNIDDSIVLQHALAESANECERLRRELKDARAEVIRLADECMIIQLAYAAVTEKYAIFEPKPEKVAE